MAYNLIITDYANERIDNILQHFLFNYKSKQVISHFLNNLEEIYTRLEINPYQFPLLNYQKDNLKYRKAIMSNMNYMIIFRMRV